MVAFRNGGPTPSGRPAATGSRNMAATVAIDSVLLEQETVNLASKYF